MKQSEKMSSLGRLIAGAAHEINNPLAVVMGKSQYLLSSFSKGNDYSSPDQSKKVFEVLQSIEGEARRCAHIVENLLSFSSNRKIEKKELDINEILRATVEMVSEQLMSANIQASLQLSEPLVSVEGNQDLLQQAFLNLMVNAKQAMSVKGGTLSIKSQNTDEEWVKVEFSDTGPGISKEHLSHIFEPFFTTKKMGRGMGLGLSIVHSIVEKHGGVVLVKSQKRRGATFTIQLPIKRKTNFWGGWV